MSTTSYIKRFVASRKPGEIFTTRDLLNYGTRSAVDKAVSRLIKAEYMIRLARGIFIKDTGQSFSFTPFEIAKVKAESFGRRIITHAKDIAHKLKLLQDGNSEITYATDGGSSSFQFGDIKIYFKKTSLKNMKLADTKVGQTIRALNYLGKNLCNKTIIKEILKEFWYTRPLKEEIIRSYAFMPFWLVKNMPWLQNDLHRWTGINPHRPVMAINTT